MVNERNLNGKFTNIINFMKRMNTEVINKRQLEKLIQSGSFDTFESNRYKLFNNVTKFVDLFGNESNNSSQSLLFEDQEYHFTMPISRTTFVTINLSTKYSDQTLQELIDLSVSKIADRKSNIIAIAVT